MNREKILKEYNKTKYTKLIICLVIDLIGVSSLIVPIIGEGFDLFWAPISGFITFLLFKGKIGLIGGAGNTLEEILPGTDIIPGATITWLVKYIVCKNQTLTEYLEEKKEEFSLLDDFFENQKKSI